MKGLKLIISLTVLFVIAGCAQQKLPPPYRQGESDSIQEASIPLETSQPGTADFKEEQGQPQDLRPAEDPGSIDVSILGAKAEPFSAGFINDRISFYKKQLENLKTLDAGSDITSLDPQQTKVLFNCSRDLQRLLDGYQGFHDKLFRGVAMVDDQSNYKNMIALQRLDIAYVNSSCATLLGETGTADAASAQGMGRSGLELIEKEIDQSFQSGDYDDVVHAWSQLPSYQRDSVDVMTAVQYADALMFLDQPAQSAEVYQQVVDRVSIPDARVNDPLTMRKHLADLYTAAGNLFEAEKQYELLMNEYGQIGSIEVWARLQLSLLEQSAKGSPELTDYTELLRSYLRYAPSKDGFVIVWNAEDFLQKYPYSPVSDNVDIIKADTQAKADVWFAALIAQTDGLVAEKQFQQAIDILQSAPADKLSPENMAQLREKLDNLMLAEAVDRETVKIEKMQELQRIWNEGTAHAESGDIDQAIDVLSQLTGTEYESKAQEKISELALAASKAERRKAADLFVRSTKTDDPEARKQLLTDSRKVLKDILIKYPEVEVADKVRGNIRQVEKKMNEIDPMLLPEIEQMEREQQMLRAPVDDEVKIEGFDVDTPSAPSVDQPKKAVIPVYTPQDIQ